MLSGPGASLDTDARMCIYGVDDVTADDRRGVDGCRCGTERHYKTETMKYGWIASVWETIGGSEVDIELIKRLDTTAHGPVDSRTHGPEQPCSCRSMDPWTNGPMEERKTQHLDVGS